MSLLELRTAKRWAWTSAMALALGLIGLFVGVTCVSAPQAVPVGIVAAFAILLLVLMPELRVVPYLTMRKSFYVLIFVVLAVPEYYALVLPPLPWISVRRAVLFVCVGATLLTLAGSSRYRKELWNKLSKTPIVSWSLASFVALSIISSLQSVSLAIAFGTLTNQFLLYYIPFLAAVLILNNIDDLEKLFAIMVICIFTNCAFGLMEFHLKYPLMIHLLPAFMRQQIVASSPAYQELVNSSMIRNGLYRALSIYNTPLSWGEMSALAAPVAAYFVVSGSSRRLRLFGVTGVLAALVSVFLSGSRGGYVGLILGLGLYFLTWSLRESRFNPKSLLGPYTLILYSMFCAIVLGAVFFVGKIHNIVLGGGRIPGQQRRSCDSVGDGLAPHT